MEQRKARVLELHSQGLTQYQIVGEFKKMGIEVSQKTISNDIATLRQDAIALVKQNREHIASEYQQALSNFHMLRKEAWRQFHATENEGVKATLYNILLSINHSIMNLNAVSDLIAQEVTAEEMQEAAEETKRQLLKIKIR